MPHNSAGDTGTGTARDVLAHRDFRIVFLGSFVSNIGRWMQSVVLTAFAWELTERPSFVSLVVFAQLIPLLMLSIVGGTLADSVDRRKLLIATQIWQAVFTLVLVVLTSRDDVAPAALVAVVFVTGLGQAIYAPTWSAVLPTLVGRENLAAAISLTSTQTNLSRVIGPAIGGVLWVAFGASTVFLINAITYIAVIAALFYVTIPPIQNAATGAGWRRLADGLLIARDDLVVRNSLILMASFSFFCLPFIGQMPTLAELNLGIDAKSGAYGVLYAFFGLGAVLGALAVGTVLRTMSKARVVRVTLTLFGLLMAVLAMMRSPLPAYPLIFLVGAVYFATTTALLTHIQAHIPDAIRGRVMALWTMSFGGMIPIGNLVAGPLIELTTVTTVLLIGATAAVVLPRIVDVEPPPRATADPLPAGRHAPEPCR